MTREPAVSAVGSAASLWLLVRSPWSAAACWGPGALDGLQKDQSPRWTSPSHPRSASVAAPRSCRWMELVPHWVRETAFGPRKYFLGACVVGLLGESLSIFQMNILVNFQVVIPYVGYEDSKVQGS